MLHPLQAVELPRFVLAFKQDVPRQHGPIVGVSIGSSHQVGSPQILGFGIAPTTVTTASKTATADMPVT